MSSLHVDEKFVYTDHAFDAGMLNHIKVCGLIVERLLHTPYAYDTHR